MVVGRERHTRHRDATVKEAARFWTVTAAHSARFALEAEEIACVVRGQELAGMFGESFSVWVDDRDLDRARSIIRGIENAPADPE